MLLKHSSVVLQEFLQLHIHIYGVYTFSQMGTTWMYGGLEHHVSVLQEQWIIFSLVQIKRSSRPITLVSSPI